MSNKKGEIKKKAILLIVLMGFIFLISQLVSANLNLSKKTPLEKWEGDLNEIKENILKNNLQKYEVKVLEEFAKLKYPLNGKHVGDEIIREFIERYQPRIAVCGHMHETQGVDKIGKTLVINVGYGRVGQFLILDIDGDNIKHKLIK